MEDIDFTQIVVLDNGTRIVVEEVITRPDSDKTFVVMKENGKLKSLYINNVYMVITEWK